MTESILRSSSTTQLRVPYSLLAAPPMADPLPSLDFKFDELRACMSDFTKRFDDFIEKGRRRVLDERNHFRIRVTAMQDQHNTTVRAIANLRLQSTSHTSTLSAQAAETKEMQSQISSLTIARDAHLTNVSALKSRLSNSKSAVNARKTSQRQQRMYMEHQTSFNEPELHAWEALLGLRIEGTGVEDRVRFIFTGLQTHRTPDGRKAWAGQCDPDREAFFDLDMATQSGSGCEIVECQPRLEREDTERCLKLMREGEDLRAFLKAMRRLFKNEFSG